MAYLPGVPNVGAPGASPGHAGSASGKQHRMQDLGGPHSGAMSTITKGDPTLRSMGHYGKGGLDAIKGGGGGIKSRVREGGLGPGKMSTAGDSSNYSMNTWDTE